MEMRALQMQLLTDSRVIVISPVPIGHQRYSRQESRGCLSFQHQRGQEMQCHAGQQTTSLERQTWRLELHTP